MLGTLLDRSSQHNGRESPPEVAEDVLERPIPIDKAKVIMYAEWLVKPVITDYVIVACCYRIGTYLAQVRKNHRDWATDGRYRIMWDHMPSRSVFDGEDVRLLCAPDKPDDSADELKFMRRLLTEIYN